MLTDPQVLTHGLEGAKTYVRQDSFNGGSDWIMETSDSADTRRLLIRHSNAGKSTTPGAGPVQRHLWQMIRESLNATTGKMEKATVNVTFTIDPGAAFTQAEILEMFDAAVNGIVADAQGVKLLRGES